LTFLFTGVTITFNANHKAYTITAPNASITFDPSVETATTTFTAGTPGQWTTTLPASAIHRTSFLDGVAFQVPEGGLPGDIDPVTWQGTFTGGGSGLTVQWEWAAAVYYKFSTNYNVLGVRVTGDERYDFDRDRDDHAGTPENFRSFVVPGATGFGRHNFTGFYSECDKCRTGVPPAVSSCRPSNSLTVLVQGANVTAYVPNGSWQYAETGVQVVPLEPTGAPTAIATPNAVNACSANWVTGQTVCTANNTDVYLITGATLNTTLTSGATRFIAFSGGTCQNCGVAINAVKNTAAITVGLSSSPSGSGLQFLDLASNTLATPIPSQFKSSEDIVWDPGRNLILSPDEQGVYDLFDTSMASAVEYANSQAYSYFDSAGEDCTTGIALATDEFSSNLFLADLTQATYTSGSPAGTWTAPSIFQNLPEFNPYNDSEAGTTGIAVAPGSHLGIVTGEFPTSPSLANAIIAIQLPSTSGTGTPTLVDYVVATLPDDPGGNPFSMGCDPHTVTAYVSPNTGKALGVVTDYGPNYCVNPTYLGIIDLQALLSAPRTGAHTAVTPLPAGIVTFVAAR
jgi:hypothetical protein